MNRPPPDPLAPPPLVCHEDDHLLAINKPPGWNTHAPDPHAGEGVYEWLRCHNPRWASLAIIHRLDKDTSGLLLFSKSRAGNQSLTQQFTARSIDKRYLLLTDRPVSQPAFEITSTLVRAGATYVSRPAAAAGQSATTRFRTLEKQGPNTLLEAHPITGRTHQIRIHAADSGIPILGDTLYHGTPSHRLHLHASQLTCLDPETQNPLTLTAPNDFSTHPRLLLRQAIAGQDTACRLVHGASDGLPGCYIDRLGNHLLVQTRSALNTSEEQVLLNLQNQLSLLGSYHKALTRNIAGTPDPSPSHLSGQPVTAPFQIQENGLRYEMRFSEGYSTGLFLDQRDNRRRLLTNYVAPGFTPFPPSQPAAEVLNTFAYTCAFSVCAAMAGHHVTSVDLSRKYLEWGRQNFSLNPLRPGDHEFLHGDVFDWLRRFAKRHQQFDLVLLDPPTFSRSRESGTFRAGKDYGKLVQAALQVLRPGGTLFCSTNAASLAPAHFIEDIRNAIAAAGRSILQQHYAPQPPDFPISREEPAYLKTVWLKVS